MAASATPVKMTKREKFEAKKRYRKARNALTREAPPPKEFTPVEKKCDTCNGPFLAKDRWSSTCDSCADLHKFRESIFGYLGLHTPTVLVTYPEYMVAITYAVTSSSHSGYCSDHRDSDIKVMNTTTVVRLPLFKEFKKADISPDNSITNTKLLDKYYIPRRGYSCNCGDGKMTYRLHWVTSPVQCYCLYIIFRPTRGGLRIKCRWYEILSAKVFKKSDMIQLDD